MEIEWNAMDGYFGMERDLDLITLCCVVLHWINTLGRLGSIGIFDSLSLAHFRGDWEGK